MKDRPLACSNAVPTSKVLIQRLNMTLRYHEGRNWHAMLDKTYYSGMVPQIRELCGGGIARPISRASPICIRDSANGIFIALLGYPSLLSPASLLT